MATVISSTLQTVTLNGDEYESYNPHSSDYEENEYSYSNSSEEDHGDNEYEESESEEGGEGSSSSSSPPKIFSNELPLPPTPTALTFTEDDLIQLSLLRDEEIDQIISSSLLPESQRFDPSLHESLTFTQPELILILTTGPHYPVLPLSYTLQNLTLPRLIIDNLRVELRKIMVTFSENESITRWLTREDNEQNYGIYEPDNIALSLLKTTSSHLTSYRNSLQSITPHPSAPLNITSQALKTRSQILSSESGIDLTTYTTPPTIQDLLGKTIPQICETIPTNYRILHVENVLKPRLYSDFHTIQSNIRSRLLTLPTPSLKKVIPVSHHHRSKSSGVLADRREKESYATYLTTPKITYHGTPRSNIPSIIKHGFLRPGDINPSTNTPLEIRCGNTYGRGIYTSPSPQFSLMYSGFDATPTPATQFSGLKLIVCATIMGRPAKVTREDNWLFQPRQTIPVLVIHLDWGKEHYEEFVNIPTNPLDWISQMAAKRKERKNKQRYEDDEESKTLFPADIVRRKQALMARALKWFPYGYGPATGTRFVVEAVAEVSDDEEEYGEYQKDKIEGVETSSNYFWEMPEIDGVDERFDEFFEERRAKAGDVIEGAKQEGDDDDDDDD
ncbi:hypothetical protein TWF103_010319 [Orbilia oligospora]|uniref:PARP catalytic domain-containing protein n=1 Tax=Orbilia oligospora TaxID=2813651 RepID=A0A7C8JKY7_ORBOL|nr:hypothetical protein TWF103_010319 [Orbilia oligospora]KAF3129536.1 hypothetical protein TWF703_008823 [Orbilia oligospora]